jgi:hypothetical protein
LLVSSCLPLRRYLDDDVSWDDFILSESYSREDDEFEEYDDFEWVDLANVAFIIVDDF